MYRLLVIWIGKIIIRLSRLRGGAGSALPGLVAEVLDPNIIAKLTRQLPQGSILVAGTNGKTTVTKMLYSILSDSGRKVIVNGTGSNMSRGVISAMLENISGFARVKGDIGLFEVDEAYIGELAAKIRPHTVVVLNLFRDQLDRYHELDRAARLIGEGLQHCQTAVLNCDDPLVVELAAYVGTQGKVLTFGAVPELQAQAPHDANLLSRATHIIKRKIKTDPKPDALLMDAKAEDQHQALEMNVSGTRYVFNLALPGVYNAYNAAAALAAARALNLNLAQATESLSRFTPPFGRAELVTVGSKKVELLLVKNPAGFNQTIQTFLLKEKNLPLLVAINDNIADGRDISWLWDVNFESLVGQEHRIITTGIRAHEMALRLKYTEISAEIEPNLEEALERFLQQLSENETGYIVPTYTAMIALRRILGKQTKLTEIWK